MAAEHANAHTGVVSALTTPIHPVAIGAGLVVVVLVAGTLYLSPVAGFALMGILVIGLPLIACVWKWPELGLFSVVFLSLGFIPQNVVDLRLPIGGLDLRDLILIGTLSLLLLQSFLSLRKTPLPLNHVSVWLIAFVGMGLVSAFYAIRFMGVAGNWAFSEVRPLIYYMVMFITAWITRTPKKLKILLVILFLMTNMTALVLILQQFLGRGNPLLEAMTSNEWYVRVQSDAANAFGAVRIVPPGHILMYAMTIVALSLLLHPNQSWRIKLVLAFEFFYLNFALLLTYTRAQWLASAIAFVVVVITLPQTQIRQLVKWIPGLVTIMAIAFLAFGSSLGSMLNNSDFFTALSVRITSLFTPAETIESSSLQWRLYETEQSLRSISEYPLLGVGVGNSYREVTLLDGEARGWLAPFDGGNFRGLTRFIHNSFLHIAVKMGVPALILYLLFGLTFLQSGWLIYKRSLDLFNKRLVVALLASFLGAMQWSITEHNLIQVDAVIGIGLITGIVAALWAHTQQQTELSQHINGIQRDIATPPELLPS